MKIYGCEVTYKSWVRKNAPFLRFRQTPRNRPREAISLDPKKVDFFVKIDVFGFIKKFYDTTCRILIFGIMKWPQKMAIF